MVESLKRQIEELEADIEELKEKKRAIESEKATEAAQEQAKMFLEEVFAPYIDGVCSIWGVSPEEALQILIREKATFDKIAKDNPKDLEKLKNQPPIKKILKIAKPLGSMSDEWIKEKMTVLLKVMKDIRPSMARGILETPGGTEWFYQSLVGLRDILWGAPKLDGKPQINIEEP